MNKESSVSKNILFWTIILLPIGLFLISLGIGRYKIPISELFKIIFAPQTPIDVPEIGRQLLLRVRLPRILGALLVGASLAATGTSFQAIFKNPLVDSNILGVTSGAGFGASLALLLLESNLQVQISAFLFGLVAVTLTFFGSRLYKTTPIFVLTLMGILIGSLFNSLIALLKYLADPLDSLPAITFWLLGTLTGITWTQLAALAVVTILGLTILFLFRWRMNILSLGDDEAQSLGIDPMKTKIILIITTTLMTAVVVSVSGIIGWVGLVIPHAGRLLVGPDHKRLLPVTISLGAAYMLILDDLARALLPGEIPIGVLTGLIGVPILILLLRSRRTGW
jgi:iron complex transport system permease protein